VQVEAPNAATTTYINDDLGNRLQEDSPDRGIITLTHDAAGNVLTRTDARGIAAAYQYDALGRVTLVDYPGTESDAAYRYDTGEGCSFGSGRLCAVTDASGGSAYAYDAFGNLVRHTRTEVGVFYTTAYAYDADDRLLALTDPSGRRVEYGRDALGRITRVELVAGEARTLLADGITYRADGLLTGLTFGNGLIETRAYDQQGRLTAQTLGGVDSREYSYDASGNLTARTAGIGGGTFTYDALNRLADGTLTYSYEPASNRLAAIGGAPVSLDLAGNLTTRDARGFTYNPAGRLVQVTENGAQIAAYHYDAHGQRSRKVTAAGTVVYHYDLQGRLLAETTADGAPLASYVWLDGRPLAMVTHSGVTFLHTDHLDTPRLGTNGGGTVVWRWDSDAFGTTAASEAPDGDGQPVTVNLRFPGQYFDSETGLHYNYFRDYDPGTGRYIESDPLGLEGGINT
jgi:RHS repeat-associated protein